MWRQLKLIEWIEKSRKPEAVFSCKATTYEWELSGDDKRKCDNAKTNDWIISEPFKDENGCEYHLTFAADGSSDAWLQWSSVRVHVDATKLNALGIERMLVDFTVEHRETGARGSHVWDIDVKGALQAEDPQQYDGFDNFEVQAFAKWNATDTEFKDTFAEVDSFKFRFNIRTDEMLRRRRR